MRAIPTLLGILFWVGSGCVDSDAPRSADGVDLGPDTEVAPESDANTPSAGPDRRAADEWLTVWNRNRRDGEPSFSSSGADSFERIADWAQGERYWVHSGGWRVLLYLRDHRVVGALVEDETGFRRRLCHETDCY